MEIAVILENSPGCQLAREVVEVREGEHFDDRVHEAVGEVIKGWLLSVGDTIRIVEVER